jgi:hypothetical protein
MMEEDFENVIVYSSNSIYMAVEIGENLRSEFYISLSDWGALMAAHSNLKERHQKLLDVAGGHYL